MGFGWEGAGMGASIVGYDDVDVFIGVDVGKGEHHAVAVDRGGKRLFDKALPNDEGRVRELIGGLKNRGRVWVVVVVDQPATIGALPLAVAQAENVIVGYLPGLAMRRIADLHAGEAKTDARDGSITAEAARSLPHALRSLELADEQVAELSMLCGFDDDLAQQITAQQPCPRAPDPDPPRPREGDRAEVGPPHGHGAAAALPVTSEPESSWREAGR